MAHIGAKLPKYLQDYRLPWMRWVRYKGVECVADVDYQKSLAAHRPIINIHYCMTEALNGRVLESVNFKAELFEASRLE